MKKNILITGMSGTGKSTLGKYLRDKGYAVHDIENIRGMFTTTDVRTGDMLTEWDVNNPEEIKHLIFACNKDMLSDLVDQESSELSFYCGTATNIVEIMPLFSKVVLLQATPDIIRHRLSTRTTHDFARSPEMQEWIIQIKKSFEDSVIERGAIVVGADGGLEETAEKVIKEVTR